MTFQLEHKPGRQIVGKVCFKQRGQPAITTLAKNGLQSHEEAENYLQRVLGEID